METFTIPFKRYFLGGHGALILTLETKRQESYSMRPCLKKERDRQTDTDTDRERRVSASQEHVERGGKGKLRGKKGSEREDS